MHVARTVVGVLRARLVLHVLCPLAQLLRVVSSLGKERMGINMLILHTHQQKYSQLTKILIKVGLYQVGNYSPMLQSHNRYKYVFIYSLYRVAEQISLA